MSIIAGNSRVELDNSSAMSDFQRALAVPVREKRALMQVEFARYLLVALAALAVDMLILSVMVRGFEIPIPWAAAAGFLGGGWVNYALSVRLVFAQRRMSSSPRSEFLYFMAIGVAGLLVTEVVMAAGVVLFPEALGAIKLAAAGVTFMINFLLRKMVLFL